MKKIIRYIFIILLCAACIPVFTACKGGISGAEAKATVNELFDAVVKEDYEMANALFHPDRATDSSEFFVMIEEESGLDFQSGVEIEETTGISSAYYDSEVGGARYELTLRIKVSESYLSFTVELVRNKTGYGIYNLHLKSI